jgi:hypothetical protein
MLLRTLIILSFLPFYSIMAQQTHGYVGVETCGMCHKTEKQGNQLSIWKGSKHSKAFLSLQTEKADQVAKEKGFTTKAADTPECLKCHVSGYNIDKSLVGEKFKMEDGVQCETCHGPGSDYKSNKIMKDKQEAVKNGLKLYEKPEEFCMGCHNAESPTYTGFVFAEMWDKIKHPLPKK